MGYEQLKLENQLCFPVYAASRLITGQYQPYLEKLGITYPQYLVLLVLWEQDGRTVNEIGSKLILNTNTLTPLLKRLESLGIVTRERSLTDERKVIISLTEKGKAMEEQAAHIPEALTAGIASEVMEVSEFFDLKEKLYKIINILLDQKNRST